MPTPTKPARVPVSASAPTSASAAFAAALAAKSSAKSAPAPVPAAAPAPAAPPAAAKFAAALAAKTAAAAAAAPKSPTKVVPATTTSAAYGSAAASKAASLRRHLEKKDDDEDEQDDEQDEDEDEQDEEDIVHEEVVDDGHRRVQTPPPAQEAASASAPARAPRTKRVSKKAAASAGASDNKKAPKQKATATERKTVRSLDAVHAARARAVENACVEVSVASGGEASTNLAVTTFKTNFASLVADAVKPASAQGAHLTTPDFQRWYHWATSNVRTFVCNALQIALNNIKLRNEARWDQSRTVCQTKPLGSIELARDERNPQCVLIVDGQHRVVTHYLLAGMLASKMASVVAERARRKNRTIDAEARQTISIGATKITVGKMFNDLVALISTGSAPTDDTPIDTTLDVSSLRVQIEVLAPLLSGFFVQLAEGGVVTDGAQRLVRLADDLRDFAHVGGTGTGDDDDADVGEGGGEHGEAMDVEPARARLAVPAYFDRTSGPMRPVLRALAEIGELFELDAYKAFFDVETADGENVYKHLYSAVDVLRNSLQCTVTMHTGHLSNEVLAQLYSDINATRYAMSNEDDIKVQVDKAASRSLRCIGLENKFENVEWHGVLEDIMRELSFPTTANTTYIRVYNALAAVLVAYRSGVLADGKGQNKLSDLNEMNVNEAPNAARMTTMLTRALETYGLRNSERLWHVTIKHRLSASADESNTAAAEDVLEKLNGLFRRLASAVVVARCTPIKSLFGSDALACRPFLRMLTVAPSHVLGVQHVLITGFAAPGETRSRTLLAEGCVALALLESLCSEVRPKSAAAAAVTVAESGESDEQDEAPKARVVRASHGARANGSLRPVAAQQAMKNAFEEPKSTLDALAFVATYLKTHTDTIKSEMPDVHNDITARMYLAQGARNQRMSATMLFALVTYDALVSKESRALPHSLAHLVEPEAHQLRVFPIVVDNKKSSTTHASHAHAHARTAALASIGNYAVARVGVVEACKDKDGGDALPQDQAWLVANNDSIHTSSQHGLETHVSAVNDAAAHDGLDTVHDDAFGEACIVDRRNKIASVLREFIVATMFKLEEYCDANSRAIESLYKPASTKDATEPKAKKASKKTASKSKKARPTKRARDVDTDSETGLHEAKKKSKKSKRKSKKAEAKAEAEAEASSSDDDPLPDVEGEGNGASNGNGTDLAFF